LQLAAETRDPLAHADQPVPRRRRQVTAAAGAVIADVEGQHRFAVAHADVDAACAGVLEDVGRRLLKDAIGGEIERGRQRRRFTLDASVDLEPGGTQLLDEGGQLANPGLRAAIWSASITAPEHPKEPVQFDEGFPGRRFDEAEGLCRRLWLARLHRPARTGLDRDYADIVGHDVVKLARDPRPLLVSGEPPVLIPLALEPRRTLLELRHVRAPG